MPNDWEIKIDLFLHYPFRLRAQFNRLTNKLLHFKFMNSVIFKPIFTYKYFTIKKIRI